MSVTTDWGEFTEARCQHSWDHRYAMISTGPAPIDYAMVCQKCDSTIDGKTLRTVTAQEFDRLTREEKR